MMCSRTKMRTDILGSTVLFCNYFSVALSSNALLQLSVWGSFVRFFWKANVCVCLRVCVYRCPCVYPTHSCGSKTSCVPNFSPVSLFFSHSVLNFTVVLLPLACCFRINDLKLCDGAISFACMFQNHFSIYKMLMLSINTFIWRHQCIRCIHNGWFIQRTSYVSLHFARWRAFIFYFYVYFVYDFFYPFLLQFFFHRHRHHHQCYHFCLKIYSYCCIFGARVQNCHSHLMCV